MRVMSCFITLLRSAASRSGLARRGLLALMVLWPLHGASGQGAAGSEPLHQRIDEMIDAVDAGPVAPTASDAQFLRRVHLALIGRIPSAAQVRAFLADSAPDKRAAMIDRLLAGADCNRHLATWFDAMLMERRPDQTVPSAEWRKYLESSFAAGKPYNELAREILTAEGADPALRPAAKFVLDRAVEPIALTRDVGRLFFGRDLQCAQCHDHPLIDSYRQAEYFGLYSFFSRSSRFPADLAATGYIADAPAGEVTFTSVFKKSVTHTSLPQVPGGPVVRDPAVPAGGEYIVAPADKVRPVPVYSRRLQLAASVWTGRNEPFNRNIVNRLWSLMMGIGLVEPLDLHHAENPPSHPAVLDLLATEFVAMDYDVKSLLREMALTRAFQRAMDPPQPGAIDAKAAAERVAALEAEHKRLDELVEPSWERVEDADAKLDDAAKARAEVAAKLAAAHTALAEARKQADAAQAALTAAQQLVTTKTVSAAALKEASAKTQEALAKLPGDKDVTEAAAKLQARVATLDAEVAAATAAVEPAGAALKAATEKVAPAQAAVKQATDELSPLDENVRKTTETHAQIFAAWTAHQAAASVAKRRLDAAKKLVSYAALADAAAASHAATDALVAERDDLRQRLDAQAHVQAQATRDTSFAHDEDVTRLATLTTHAETAAAKSLADAAAADAAYQELTQQWARQFTVIPLEPLTPEQIAWSTMQATGLLEQTRAAAEAELNQKSPLPEVFRDDAMLMAARGEQIEQMVYDRLKGHEAVFVRLFGAGAGQDPQQFSANIDQALFLSNDGLVRSWLAPAGGNLVDRLTKIEDVTKLADELYVSVLSRPPSEQEVEQVRQYLEPRSADRAVALGELAWALLASVEFRFRH